MTQLERDIEADDDDRDLPPLPRTELDSHTNMVLLGKHSFIFDGAPRNTCEVVPFDPRSIGNMFSYMWMIPCVSSTFYNLILILILILIL